MDRNPTNGQFVPGHRQPGPGRPKREREEAVLAAISDALSPEEIKNAITTALDLAIEQKSPRGIVAVLELCSGYAVGKPVQRVQQSSGGLQDILDMLDRSGK
jgi:hypothetical protein